MSVQPGVRVNLDAQLDLARYRRAFRLHVARKGDRIEACGGDSILACAPPTADVNRCGVELADESERFRWDRDPTLGGHGKGRGGAVKRPVGQPRATPPADAVPHERACVDVHRDAIGLQQERQLLARGEVGERLYIDRYVVDPTPRVQKLGTLRPFLTRAMISLVYLVFEFPPAHTHSHADGSGDGIQAILGSDKPFVGSAPPRAIIDLNGCKGKLKYLVCFKRLFLYRRAKRNGAWRTQRSLQTSGFFSELRIGRDRLCERAVKLRVGCDRLLKLSPPMRPY